MKKLKVALVGLGFGGAFAKIYKKGKPGKGM